MSKIWFTSDPHYNHKNICKGTSEWNNTDRCRNFSSVEEMNNAIVEGINKHVNKDDILYCLGDWSFGGVESIWEFRKRINCKNIHLILGNHDHHIANNRKILIQNSNLDTYAKIVTDADYNTYIHEVNMECDSSNNIIGFQVPIRSLFSSVNQMFIKEIGGQDMTLCHYAMRTWDKAHHGTWMLYGHSHGTLPEYSSVKGFPKKNSEIYRTMDVGVDNMYTLLGEYRPISFEEIKKLFDQRPALLVDHHNKNTKQ